MFFARTAGLLRDVARRGRSSPWFRNRALVISTALIGTFTASIFSSRLYGESTYWMCALAFALHRIQSTELSTQDKDEPCAAVA
jgi:hypothetical protein